MPRRFGMCVRAQESPRRTGGRLITTKRVSTVGVEARRSEKGRSGPLLVDEVLKSRFNVVGVTGQSVLNLFGRDLGVGKDGAQEVQRGHGVSRIRARKTAIARGKPGANLIQMESGRIGRGG